MEHRAGAYGSPSATLEIHMDKDTVTIPRSEYESLKDDAKWRQCLESGGVDNWSYYHESLKDGGYFKDEDDEV